jgi:hypothetical protein
VAGWLVEASDDRSACAPAGVVPRNAIRAIAAVFFMAGW